VVLIHNLFPLERKRALNNIKRIQDIVPIKTTHRKMLHMTRKLLIFSYFKSYYR